MDSPKMRLSIIKVFCCGLSGSWIRNFKSIYSKYDLDLEKMKLNENILLEALLEFRSSATANWVQQ